MLLAHPESEQVLLILQGGVPDRLLSESRARDGSDDCLDLLLEILAVFVAARTPAMAMRVLFLTMLTKPAWERWGQPLAKMASMTGCTIFQNAVRAVRLIRLARVMRHRNTASPSRGALHVRSLRPPLTRYTAGATFNRRFAKYVH